MKKVITLVFLIAIAGICDPYSYLRTNTTKNTKHLYTGTVDSLIPSKEIQAGSCVIGAHVTSEVLRIVSKKDKSVFSGFMHARDLFSDTSCMIEIEQDLQCDLMIRILSEVNTFVEFDTWQSTYFVQRCDDGYFAEAISDKVMVILSKNMSESIAQMQSREISSKAKELIVKHMDLSADSVTTK
ncbi:MAG TPA: hypothetical protein PK208_00630 [Fibrobacteria bacterium]|nr:hypothetical protein [Fibrobacteria bacterium]